MSIDTRFPVGRVAELARTTVEAVKILAGRRMTQGQALRTLPTEVAAALDDARRRFALPPPWTPGDRLTTVADVAVIELRSGPVLAAVLKIGRSPAGDAGLLQQQHTLLRLADDPTLGTWRRLLPDVLAHGVVGARRYSIERAVAGTVGAGLPGSPGTGTAAADAAVGAISELHRATGRATVASAALVDRWLEPALSLVADTPMVLAPGRRRALVDRLRERLGSALEGRRVWLSRTHGDFFPGNVFFGPDGGVEGVIDWAQSREDDPALIDPMTLLLVGRARAQGRELGQVVRSLCRGAPLSGPESALLEFHRAACPADPLGVDVMALVAWLRHVENDLLKSPRYRVNPVWVHGNLETVLRTIGDGPGGSGHRAEPRRSGGASVQART